MGRGLTSTSKLGFDRNDLSTVHKDKLPLINEKGMCLHYALPHEDFVWGVRSEPGVVGAFEKIYDDEDLIVSFDAINFQFPKYVLTPDDNAKVYANTRTAAPISPPTSPGRTRTRTPRSTASAACRVS